MHPEMDYKSRARSLQTKVYSRGRCRCMLNEFASVRLRTRSFPMGASDPVLGELDKSVSRRYENVGRRLGWYVTMFARK